jgi:predicted nucleotidyltransferase
MEIAVKKHKEARKVDENLLNEVVQRILTVTNPDKIILFGSYARGDANKDSDLDILIIQPSDLPRYKRSTPIRLALLGVFPSKDIVVYTPEEVEEWKTASASFIANVLREGKILYEKQC